MGLLEYNILYLRDFLFVAITMINFLSRNKNLQVVGPSSPSSSPPSDSSFVKPNDSKNKQKQRRARRPSLAGSLKSESDHRPSRRGSNGSSSLVTSKNDHGSSPPQSRIRRFPSSVLVGASSNSSERSNANNKSVRFERKAQVKRVKPRYLFNEHEREAMWHTETDYAFIKRRAVETVQLMARSKGPNPNYSFVEDEHHTARGLECRLKEAALQRKEFKNFARDVVLGEQASQYIRGDIPNPARIRNAYLEASTVALEKARRLAMLDQDAVRQTDGEDCLRAILLAVREEHAANAARYMHRPQQ